MSESAGGFLKDYGKLIFTVGGLIFAYAVLQTTVKYLDKDSTALKTDVQELNKFKAQQEVKNEYVKTELVSINSKLDTILLRLPYRGRDERNGE